MRLVIDTDPGIDDAVAILWALRHPGFEIAALTTVAGNIGLEQVTRNALRLLALAGREVPVHAGSAAPLLWPGSDESAIHGRDGLGGVVFPEPVAAASSVPAATALAELLTASPAGSVTLACLGPLTNLALLLRRAPQAARRLSRVVAMGGALAERGNVGPRSEFNLAHDCDAAAEVVAAGLDLTLIPLDVTRRVRADAAWLAALPQTPPAQAVRGLVAAYFDATSDADRPTSRPLHDPCVPLLLAAPELFEVREHSLAVDCRSDPGALVRGPHKVKVATGVRSAEVLALLSAGLG